MKKIYVTNLGGAMCFFIKKKMCIQIWVGEGLNLSGYVHDHTFIKKTYMTTPPSNHLSSLVWFWQMNQTPNNNYSALLLSVCFQYKTTFGQFACLLCCACFLFINSKRNWQEFAGHILVEKEATYRTKTATTTKQEGPHSQLTFLLHYKKDATCCFYGFLSSFHHLLLHERCFSKFFIRIPSPAAKVNS